MTDNQSTEHSSSHHHHHHHDDFASRYKRKNLRGIIFRRKAEKWLKLLLLFVAMVMVAIVVYLYIA